MDNLIANLRKDYKSKTLNFEDTHENPFEQFKQWFDETLDAQIVEPNAMTLATATKSGKPSARIVLLKGYDQEGFVFYTNFESRKGMEITKNPHAALVFNWLDLERQIRIEGKVEKVADITATEYFQSRPKLSQIGAWASPQSQEITDRSVLENNFKALDLQYAHTATLPKPDCWGGFRVMPTYIEFWQGRRSRLHDRVVYKKKRNGTWHKVRLAP
jgi:pyridoxamine 5'-phosphate oxidase